MSAALQLFSPTCDKTSPNSISKLSKELVIAVVGYAGAGCTTAADRIEAFLREGGYDVKRIKVSELIDVASGEPINVSHGPNDGLAKFARARRLQDLGDRLRNEHGNHALAALAVQRIRKRRGAARPGEEKIAFLIDSLKHPEEVRFLRRIYDASFRLVAVHCERTNREKRLIGDPRSTVKFKGVVKADVQRFMDRDEKDSQQKHGQQVRDTFYLGDSS